MSLNPARLSPEAATAISKPCFKYENKKCVGSSQVSEEALGNNSWALPPNVGTTQVSYLSTSLRVKAISEPSGEKLGINFMPDPEVSCTGSPLGSGLTY